MRTKFRQLPRYLELHLAISCGRPLIHDPWDQTDKRGPLYTPLSLQLPALEKTKPATSLHLPLYVTPDVSCPMLECPSPDSVRALLSYGNNVLLHNYNNQTPVDLAEGAGRQGRTLRLRSKEQVTVKRWNVTHATDIHDPTHPRSRVIFKDVPLTSKHPDEFVFVESSHLLLPNYQLMDMLGLWVVLKEPKEFANRNRSVEAGVKSKIKIRISEAEEI